jgi:hypothetical protein
MSLPRDFKFYNTFSVPALISASEASAFHDLMIRSASASARVCSSSFAPSPIQIDTAHLFSLSALGSTGNNTCGRSGH